MSDAIREAFEAWWRGWSNIAPTRQGEGYAEVAENVAWTTWQAALQSQIALSLPEREIAAKALEGFAARIRGVVSEWPTACDQAVNSAITWAEAAEEEAARLRASQQEDRGSEFAAFISRGLRDTAGDDGEAVGNGSPDIIDRLDNSTGAGDY